MYQEVEGVILIASLQKRSPYLDVDKISEWFITAGINPPAGILWSIEMMLDEPSLGSLALNLH